MKSFEIDFQMQRVIWRSNGKWRRTLRPLGRMDISRVRSRLSASESVFSALNTTNCVPTSVIWMKSTKLHDQIALKCNTKDKNCAKKCVVTYFLVAQVQGLELMVNGLQSKPLFGLDQFILQLVKLVGPSALLVPGRIPPLHNHLFLDHQFISRSQL